MIQVNDHYTYLIFLRLRLPTLPGQKDRTCMLSFRQECAHCEIWYYRNVI